LQERKESPFVAREKAYTLVAGNGGKKRGADQPYLSGLLGVQTQQRYTVGKKKRNDTPISRTRRVLPLPGTKIVSNPGEQGRGTVLRSWLPLTRREKKGGEKEQAKSLHLTIVEALVASTWRIGEQGGGGKKTIKTITSLGVVLSFDGRTIRGSQPKKEAAVGTIKEAVHDSFTTRYRSRA